MFQFIWHLKGSIALDASASDSNVIENIASTLEKQRKHITECRNEFVSFKSPLWEGILGPNWLTLTIYDSGQIWIDKTSDQRKLCYDIRSFQAFVYVTSLAIFIFFYSLIGNDISRGLMIGGATLAWLYGMNILLALIRVPLLFRRAART